MTKVFITGITGYIAGDGLYVLSRAHPEYELSALVRSQEKADIVKKEYPNVRIVLGGLDDFDILKGEAAKADIVLHAADASDHEGAAKAIIAGLLAGHTKENPGFWLHTSGTGILVWEDARDGAPGRWSDKQYNDWDGVGELTHLPDEAFHRDIDKIVLEAGEKHGDVIKTAIICPPTIYGTGRGPVSGRSRQVYEMTKLVLTGKYIPIIGEGKARWNNVHVHDLSQLYLLLTEAAASKKMDSELWGPTGYYLAENGEHLWSEIAEKIGHEVERAGLAKGLDKRSLSKEAALDQAGFEAVSWGLNSRGKAERAQRLLGWEPAAPSLEYELTGIVQSEHQRLQKPS